MTPSKWPDPVLGTSSRKANHCIINVQEIGATVAHPSNLSLSLDVLLHCFLYLPFPEKGKSVLGSSLIVIIYLMIDFL